MLRKELFFAFYIIFWYHDFQAWWETVSQKMKNGYRPPTL